MNRKPQIVELMGLGPIWRLRETQPMSSSRAWLQTRPTEPEPILIEPDTTPSPPTVSAPRLPSAAEMAAPSDQLSAIVTPSSWETLKQTVQSCQQCRLCDTRTQAVFGRGNRHARWLIVGEAPGEQEDRQGLPFVGRAGRLLDNILAAAGLSPQEDVFIANVLKCRPPGNRNPAGDEIAACQSYLLQQIAHIQPALIVALGRFAAQTLLQTELSISRLRGRIHDFEGCPLIVSYHPAYLLRNPPDKAKAWQDWVFAKKTLAQN